MELLISDEGKPIYRGRALTRPHRMASLEMARTLPFNVEDMPTPISVLHRFLGIAASPNQDTRLHELTFWSPAFDWACRETGRRRPSPGATVVGSTALKVVKDHWELRSSDIRRLTSATITALGTSSPARQERVQAVDIFRSLLADVRLVALVDEGAGVILEGYESDDLVALAAAEALAYSRLGEPLTQCQHCSAWFIPNQRVDEIYCRRAAPGQPVGGASCHQLGPQSRFARESSDLTREYRRRYKLLDSRVRRGRLQRSDVDKWRLRAQELLERAHARAEPLEAFRRALDKIERVNEE